MELIQKNLKMTNVVLCGGSSVRLWPISRTLMTKQFDDKSLFQLTVERNSIKPQQFKTTK